MSTPTAWGLFFLAALILAALSWPARSADPFVKPTAPALITHKIFPPAQYDHYYEGDLTIRIVDNLEELRSICRLDNPKLLACSWHNQVSCIIVLVKNEVMRQRSWTTGMLLRHEIGHCNGWGRDHAGERSIPWPTTHWVNEAERVKIPGYRLEQAVSIRAKDQPR